LKLELAAQEKIISDGNDIFIIRLHSNITYSSTYHKLASTEGLTMWQSIYC